MAHDLHADQPRRLGSRFGAWVLIFALLAACRCGEAASPAVDAAAPHEWRLELLDDRDGHRGAALAFGEGGLLAAGDDGSVELWVGERLLGRVDVPGYRGGELAIVAGQVKAWPYRVSVVEGRIEAPDVIEAIPTRRAVPTVDGWIALLGDATASTATLALLDPAGANRETLGEVTAGAVLASRDALIAVGSTDVLLRGAGPDRRLPESRYALRALAFADDRLLGLDASGALLVWDLETGAVAPLVAHMGDAQALAVGADDRFVATGGTDGRVAVWAVASLPRRAGVSVEPLAEVTFPGVVEAIAWHPSRAELVVGLREPRRDRLVRLGLRQRTH